MFAQWTTTVPPEELTGSWDLGVLITDGPSGHLRRNATAYNTHKSLLVIMNSIDTSLCCHINDYVYTQLTYTRTLLIAHAFMYNHIYIKTHGSVSAAKEVMWHTSVLFTGTAKSPFSTPHISITT